MDKEEGSGGNRGEGRGIGVVTDFKALLSGAPLSLEVPLLLRT